jgi:hypothetical protein
VENDDESVKIQKDILNTITGEIDEQTGKSIVDITLDAAEKTTADESKARILKTGLEEIKNHPDTTQDEKTIAELGLDFSGYRSNDEQAVKIQKDILNRISTGINEPIGKEIVDAAFGNIYSESDRYMYRKVFGRSFEEVASHPDTTQEQKEIADLALRFEKLDAHPGNMQFLMTKIADGITEPMGEFYAKATLEAAETGKEKRKVMEMGFQEIMDHPDTTQREKTIAEIGTRINKVSCYEDETVGAMKHVMRNVTADVDGSEVEFIGNMMLEAIDGLEDESRIQLQTLDAGLETIASHPDATTEQKEATELSMKFHGRNDHGHKENVEIKKILLRSVIDEIKEPMGEYLVNSVFHAVAEAGEDISKTSVMQLGFEAIGAHSGTTREENNVAGIGYNFSRCEEIFLEPGVYRFRNDKLRGESDNVSKIQKDIMNRVTGGIDEPVGEFIMKTALKGASEARTGEGQAAIIQQGFKSIMEHPDTTKEEKAVADIGYWFSICSDPDHEAELADVLKLQYNLMNKVTSGIDEPVGEFIVKTALDAAAEARKDTTKKSILLQGFQAIMAHPDTTQEEKKTAEIGYDFSYCRLNGTGLLNVQKDLMNRVTGGINEPIGEFIANTAFDAAEKARNDQTKRVFMRQGFEAITNHPDTTKEQKVIAELGNELYDYYEESVKIDEDLMNKIINGIDEPIAEFFIDTATAANTGRCTPKQSEDNFKQGFKAIIDHPDTTHKEKTLAIFYKACGDNLYKADMDKIRPLVVDKMFSESKEPINQSVANISIDAYEEAARENSWSVAQHILEAGFEAIKENPVADAGEIELADKGIRRLKGSDGEDTKAIKAARELMESIYDHEELLKTEMEDYLGDDNNSAGQHQEQLPGDTDDRVRIGDTFVSKRKQGPPPMEIGLFRLKS